MRTQLAAAAKDERLCMSVKQVEQHPIPDSELQGLMLGVIESASVLLCLKQTSMDLGQTHHGWTTRPRQPPCAPPLKHKAERPTIDHLEQRSLKHCVISSIIAKFYRWQLVQPITRTITSEAPQVHGDGLVHYFGLPICLWMDSSTHPKVDVGVSKKITPHLSCEHRIPIIDDGLQKSMEPHDILKEGVSH